MAHTISYSKSKPRASLPSAWASLGIENIILFYFKLIVFLSNR